MQIGLVFRRVYNEKFEFMIQYLKMSETIDEIELDNKYHLEQLEIITDIINNLEKDKKYLEERLRLDKIRIEKLSKPKN